MSALSDREHFQSYRRQTEVKHVILEKYLPAYLHILKGYHGKIVYFDAFAGRGYYQDESSARQPGSPIRALTQISRDSTLAERTVCVFSEADQENYNALEQAIDEFLRKHPPIAKPLLFHGTFSDAIKWLEALPSYPSLRDAPTFLFVDPCGLAGADFDAIANYLCKPRCEVFIFFNVDGLRRTAGLELQSGQPSEVLIQLLGDKTSANDLCKRLANVSTSEEGDRVAVETYINRLRTATGAKYFVPYRIEYNHRQTTSHYLIHATKHPLGFLIMKDVMWTAAGPDVPGGLEFAQASNQFGGLLFQPNAAEVDSTILNTLQHGGVQVKQLIDDLSARPDDMVAPKFYKERLIALEHVGKIEVLRNGSVYLATSRPRRNGAVTLGDDYIVRLKQQQV